MKIFQSRIWLLVGIVATLLFVGILANPSLNYQSITMDELLTAITESRVKEIRVINSTTVNVIYNDGTQVRTKKDADFDLLAAANVDDVTKAILYSEENNPLGEVLRAGTLIILPLIALTTFYMFYIGWSNAKKAGSSS